MIETVLIITGLCGLVIASYNDFETREIPNWISFSLIAAGIGLRLIGVVAEKNVFMIVFGVAGLIIMAVLGEALYYSRQWGGGDTKLLMGMGALFGSLSFSPWFLFHFLVNLVVVGAAYGLLWSVYLAIRYHRKFRKAVVSTFKENKKQAYILGGFGVLALLASVIVPSSMMSLFLLLAGALALLYIILILFVKTVESSCMYRRIKVQHLTEGDWIAHDVIAENKTIYHYTEPGVGREQIALMQKLHLGRVTVKDGIPFVPSFLLAMITTLAVGNVFLLLI